MNKQKSSFSYDIFRNFHDFHIHEGTVQKIFKFWNLVKGSSNHGDALYYFSMQGLK